eukprot:6206868-Pleurochrysis_carterae.AAC.2
MAQALQQASVCNYFSHQRRDAVYYHHRSGDPVSCTISASNCTVILAVTSAWHVFDQCAARNFAYELQNCPCMRPTLREHVHAEQRGPALLLPT